MCDSEFISYGLVCSLSRRVTGVTPSLSAMDWFVLCPGVLQV